MCANVEVKKVCQIAGAQASSGPKGPEPRHRFSPGGPQPGPAISRSQRGLYSFGDNNNAGTKSDKACVYALAVHDSYDQYKPARGSARACEEMCYGMLRAAACVDESDHVRTEVPSHVYAMSRMSL